MTPSYFDTHGHLQDDRLDGDRAELLDRAHQAGVRFHVCCGVMERDWTKVLALADRHSEILPMLGFHPWFLDELGPGWPGRLWKSLVESGAGVGECGLDFAMENPNRTLQEQVFREHLNIAVELNRPLSIHCRRAWNQLLTCVQDIGLPKRGAVIHAFSGSEEMALQLQRAGLYLGFGGSITRPNPSRASKVLPVVWPDRLVLETDTPDIPPHFEGAIAERSEPCHLPYIAQRAASLRGEDLNRLTQQAWENATRIFCNT